MRFYLLIWFHNTPQSFLRLLYFFKKCLNLDFFSQILIVLAVAFGPFSVGLSKGYTSPALASLMSINNATISSSNSSTSATSAAAADIHITAQEGSWIASLSLLGALFGGLLASQLLKFGRRTCLLVTAVPFSASWGLTVFATSVQMIYATAFLAGNAEYSGFILFFYNCAKE